MRGPWRVLVVDDDSDVEARLSQLNDERHEFVCVADGNEVLRRVGGEQWDLLLVDVNLLILRGERLVAMLLKRVPKHRQPPILFFSSEDDDRLASLVREHGVAGFASKSWRNAQLLEAIKAHMPVA